MFFQNLYLHFPFCRSKCLHCSFYSCPLSSEEDLQACLDALEKEIEIYGRLFPGQRLASLYLGGGTPSLLSPVNWARVLEKINTYFPLYSFCEVTMEANPEDLDGSYLKELGSAGINRLSLGWQSSFTNLLVVLGRRQQACSLQEKVDLTYRAGISNINIDLIYGLPGQTMFQWEKNLQEACNAFPGHISVYGLHLEESVPLQKHLLMGFVPALPGEETLRDMFLLGKQILAARGFKHYEIASHALPGYQCRHNMAYWENKPYLALGPGAHGYLLDGRYANISFLQDYKKSLFSGRLPWGSVERISLKAAMEEHMFLGLRLLKGVDRKAFCKKFGLDPLHFFQKNILSLKEKKLLHVTDSTIKLSPTGLLLANLVFQEFVA